MTKYEPLTHWLREYPADRVTLPFSQVEEIIGSTLPPSSYNHEAHWRSSDGERPGAAIDRAGWRVTRVDQFGKSVSLVRTLRVDKVR